MVEVLESCLEMLWNTTPVFSIYFQLPASQARLPSWSWVAMLFVEIQPITIKSKSLTFVSQHHKTLWWKNGNLCYIGFIPTVCLVMSNILRVLAVFESTTYCAEYHCLLALWGGKWIAGNDHVLHWSCDTLYHAIDILYICYFHAYFVMLNFTQRTNSNFLLLHLNNMWQLYSLVYLWDSK